MDTPIHVERNFSLDRSRVKQLTRKRTHVELAQLVHIPICPLVYLIFESRGPVSRKDDAEILVG